LTLWYGDAEAHLNIARRIFDARERAMVIGTVWLPVPRGRAAGDRRRFTMAGTPAVCCLWACSCFWQLALFQAKRQMARSPPGEPESAPSGA
jgi:hypothetical protein